MTQSGKPFNITLLHLDGTVDLLLEGELDMAVGHDLHETVAGLLGTHLGAITLVVGALTFVDVAGLRAIRAVGVTAESVGAELHIRGAGDLMRRLIDLTQFADLAAALETAPEPGRPRRP